MKTLLESSESFTAYATIDAGRYMLGELLKRLMMPKAPINYAIDKSTGFEKAERKEIIEDAIAILEDVIPAKEFLLSEEKDKDVLERLDVEKDKKMLESLKQMLSV